MILPMTVRFPPRQGVEIVSPAQAQWPAVIRKVWAPLRAGSPAVQDHPRPAREVLARLIAMPLTQGAAGAVQFVEELAVIRVPVVVAGSTHASHDIVDDGLGHRVPPLRRGWRARAVRPADRPALVRSVADQKEDLTPAPLTA